MLRNIPMIALRTLLLGRAATVGVRSVFIEGRLRSGSMQKISIIKKFRNDTRINNPSEDEPVAATLRRTLMEMLIHRKGKVKIKRTHGTK